jgi:hypothetical protein
MMPIMLNSLKSITFMRLIDSIKRIVILAGEPAFDPRRPARRL